MRAGWGEHTGQETVGMEAEARQADRRRWPTSGEHSGQDLWEVAGRALRHEAREQAAKVSRATSSTLSCGRFRKVTGKD